jgi:surface polysaccharide O-acyltransferase-like enzyme
LHFLTAILGLFGRGILSVFWNSLFLLFDVFESAVAENKRVVAVGFAARVVSQPCGYFSRSGSFKSSAIERRT